VSGGPRGLAAPDGYVWCRGAAGSGSWHVLRAAELFHQGAARVTARSVCGLWASLLPAENAWAEVTPRMTPGPRPLCPACLAAVAEAQRRERVKAASAAQPRLL
jgi:hypothetical protein